MKIFLGVDHRGFKLKEKIKDFLAKEKIPFEDLGNFIFFQIMTIPILLSGLPKKWQKPKKGLIKLKRSKKNLQI